MTKIFMFLAMFFLGCEPSPTTPELAPIPPKVLNIAAATAKAEAYVQVLYASREPAGPVCLPEAVEADKTRCSFTYIDTDKSFKAGTILCNADGCSPEVVGASVSAEDRPTIVVTNGQPQNNNASNDWLFWYLLSTSGGTQHHYHAWYDSTPNYGRNVYYTSTYTPPTQSRTYYTTTYSQPVKYTTRTTTVTSTGTRTAKPVSSSTVTSTGTKSYNSSSSSTATKSSTTKSSTRSSGWGSSSRSSGYKSSGSSSRSSSSRSSSRSGRR